MTFTYDTGLATSVSWVRLQIGDTKVGAGPRVDGTNFSDEEIEALLGLNKNDVTDVTSQLFNILATEWTRMAMTYTIGPRKEDYTKIADLYTKKALHWSNIAGTLFKTFSAGTKRLSDADASIT